MAEVAHLIIYEKICSMINTNNQQTNKKERKITEPTKMNETLLLKEI